MARKPATMDAPAAGFVGRRAELAALAAAAGRPAGGRCRVVVLAGRPGSGRSALAREYARSVAADFPDGVCRLRMAAPDGTPVEAGVAARRLLEQLGAQPEAEPEAACAALRKVLAGRRVLLLLDDVVDAGQLRPLLPADPGCLVLAVTAGPLTGIADIDPVILGGLDPAAAVALLAQLVGSTRISCDPVGAAELVDACACRPAALRLLAGWLRDHPKAALADAVQAMPEAVPAPPVVLRLETEPVPVPDGDPLAGAFALRYGALSAGRARMLRMLTLAPGQVADLRTASALVGCPGPEAGELLAGLAGLELLEAEPPAGDGTPRYRVPGRLYGRLAALRATADRPGEVELARARLLERLVRLVDSARELLQTGRLADPLPGPLRLRTRAQARQWLLEEREQLLGAAGAAIGRADLDGTADRLVTALLRALPLTGEATPADQYRLHELVLRVAERRDAPRRAAAALLNLADLRAAAGRWEPAAEHYRAAIGHARRAGDEPATARALEGVGDAHRALGDPVRAADWYGRALALRQSLGDPRAEARLLARRAEAHTAQRRYEEAAREYRSALTTLRRLGDEHRAGAVSARLELVRQRAADERDAAFEE